MTHSTHKWCRSEVACSHGGWDVEGNMIPYDSLLEPWSIPWILWSCMSIEVHRFFFGNVCPGNLLPGHPSFLKIFRECIPWTSPGKISAGSCVEKSRITPLAGNKIFIQNIHEYCIIYGKQISWLVWRLNISEDTLWHLSNTATPDKINQTKFQKRLWLPSPCGS